jgi:hypothetical protein
MNELNWKWVYIPYLDAPDKQKESAIKAGYAKVYFKSEVDKVIAEKDAYIAELKGDNERLRGESCKLTDGCLRLKQCRKDKANIADELRHQKYKRCLAMARLCGKTVDHLNSEGYIYEKENHIKELTDCIRGTEFYDKWYHRWLALAEEQTWAKFLQLIHNEASK